MGVSFFFGGHFSREKSGTCEMVSPNQTLLIIIITRLAHTSQNSPSRSSLDVWRLKTLLSCWTTRTKN